MKPSNGLDQCTQIEQNKHTKEERRLKEEDPIADKRFLEKDSTVSKNPIAEGETEENNQIKP